jgi:hypothetical protein
MELQENYIWLPKTKMSPCIEILAMQRLSTVEQGQNVVRQIKFTVHNRNFQKLQITSFAFSDVSELPASAITSMLESERPAADDVASSLVSTTPE